jgi:hypothetical protein
MSSATLAALMKMKSRRGPHASRQTRQNADTGASAASTTTAKRRITGAAFGVARRRRRKRRAAIRRSFATRRSRSPLACARRFQGARANWRGWQLNLTPAARRRPPSSRCSPTSGAAALVADDSELNLVRLWSNANTFAHVTLPRTPSPVHPQSPQPVTGARDKRDYEAPIQFARLLGLRAVDRLRLEALGASPQSRHSLSSSALVRCLPALFMRRNRAPLSEFV